MKLNPIQQYYDVLETEEIDQVQMYLNSSNWEFGQKSSPESPKQFWYMELFELDFFKKYMFDKISNLTSKNFFLHRVYANGQTYGLDSEWHTDSEKN